MKKPQYNLTAEEALVQIRVQLSKMEAETDRSQLIGVDPDRAYEMGYAGAVLDLDILTGPDPQVVLAALKKDL